MNTYALLLVDRFLLGVVEAVVIPAMVVLLSHWFTKRERGRADTVLILGNPVTLLWMSIVSGFLVQAVGYRWMFIIEGMPAIIWAFIFRALADDPPTDAAWLFTDESSVIDERLAAEQSDRPESSGLRAALRSRNAIVLSGQYLLWSVGVYGWCSGYRPSSSGSPARYRHHRIAHRGALRGGDHRMLSISTASDRTTHVAAAAMYAPYFAYIRELFRAEDAGPPSAWSTRSVGWAASSVPTSSGGSAAPARPRGNRAWTDRAEARQRLRR